MSDDQPLPPPTLRAEAAAWFAKMRGDDAALHRAAFEQWLARGALHRAAYNRVGEIFAAGKILKSEAGSAQTIPERNGRWWAAAALVSVATGLVILHTSGRGPVTDNMPRVAQSASPAARTLTWSAGETALLDVDGAIAVPDPAQEAAVRLVRGRARFTIAADGQDHIVFAGATQVRSHGGTFDLWLKPGGSVHARVLFGDVRLLPAALATSWRAGPGVIRLSAGEYCSIDAGGRADRSQASHGTGWPQGILEFQATALADVLEEANRYSAIKIALADPSLGARRITGRFAVSDARRLARRLALALSLDADDVNPRLIVLRTKKFPTRT